MKLRIIGLWTTLLLLSLTFPVHAAGVVGDGTPASCTFKALKKAVKLGGDISFNCGAEVVIPFTKTLKIKMDTTLDGGGQVTFDGGKAVRILLVESYANLTVRGLTFQHGLAVTNGNDDGGEGSAISGLWRSNLTIEDTKFIKNKSFAESFDYGGAVRLHEGTLVIRGSEFFKNKVKGGSGGAVFGMLSNVDISDTVFTKNKSDGFGGAFYNDGTLMHTENGYIRFTRVDFIGNQGKGQGGAVFNFLYGNPSGELYQPGASLSVTDTSFVDNVIEPSEDSPALGGGLRIGNGPATLTNVLFANNHATHQGGAIWTGEVTGGTFTNVTMTGNTAEYGGALTVGSSGKLEIVNGTIVYNQAVQGGGIWSDEDSSIKLWNTILANNTASNPWDLKHNCGYPLKDGGGVIEFPQADGNEGDPTCVEGATFVDPLLQPLTDNGGRFATHALSAGSPAINTGQNDVCPATDARGLPRDGQCDVGAYEVQAAGVLALP